MPVVSILHEVIPQYRVPFFEGLRDRLGAEGVTLRVGQGRPPSRFAAREDSQPLAWATPLPQVNLPLRGHDLVCLDPRPVLRGADLVVATQEIRQLQNLALWGLSRLGGPRLAWWGHGRDFAKPDAQHPGERLKRFLSARAHWWFAYNHLSARTVAALGFPPERITAVINSTDTSTLQQHRATTTPADLAQLRARLGLGPGPLGLYVGALAPIKQLPYLLAAADAIRARIPTFELLMVGKGPEEAALQAMSAGRPWIHWLGTAFGRDKVQLMLLAQVGLLPAWVGLGIVDAFALGLPLVTTDAFPHSVEIDYLNHGRNGWMVPGRPDPATYGEAVADLLQTPGTLAHLRRGCLEAASTYTLEAMVGAFTHGILHALAAPRHLTRQP